MNTIPILDNGQNKRLTYSNILKSLSNGQIQNLEVSYWIPLKDFYMIATNISFWHLAKDMAMKLYYSKVMLSSKDRRHLSCLIVLCDRRINIERDSADSFMATRGKF